MMSGCDKLHTQHANVRQQIIMYTKFLEALQRIVRQYNLLLLSFIYFDTGFFIG